MRAIPIAVPCAGSQAVGQEGRLLQAAPAPGSSDGTGTWSQSPAWKSRNEAPGGDGAGARSPATGRKAYNELLAQWRLRRSLEKQQGEVKGNGWFRIARNRNVSELEARQLTRSIVELGKRRQLEKVFEAIETARKDGKATNVITMNAVVAACVNCHNIDRALGVFKEMVQPSGVGADSVTYGTILKGLGEAKRLDDAFELLEVMEAGNAPGRPDVTDVHVNTLINACAEAGDALRARSLLQRYRRPGRAKGPSTLTYNLLIKGYANSDTPLEALSVRDDMRQLGLAPQRLTYNSLILACIRGGDLPKAMQLLEEMKVEARRLENPSLLPDVVTYTTLLKGLSKAGNVEEVLQLVEEMQSSPACVLDRVALTAIIDACILAGTVEEGMRVMEEMNKRAEQDAHFRPRPHVFLALMRALAPRGDVERTRQLAQRLEACAAGRAAEAARAEAGELLLEAAVVGGQAPLGREILDSIVKAQGVTLSFSQRANQALVGLCALSDSSFDLFRPLEFCPEVSPRAEVQSLMRSATMLPPVSPRQLVAEVAARLEAVDALPVVSADGTCVGVLHSKDCKELDADVEAVMGPPPPRIAANAQVSQAATLLVSQKADLLVVVESFEVDPGDRLRKEGEVELGTTALGFVLRSDVLYDEKKPSWLGRGVLGTAEVEDQRRRAILLRDLYKS